MPSDTTVGRLVVEDALPPDVRPALKALTKKGLNEVLSLVAKLHPEQYKDVAKRLQDAGARASYESGGYSFGVSDMRPGPRAAAEREQYRQKVRQILADGTLPPDRRDAALVTAALEAMGRVDKAVFEEHTAARNPLALQVASGAKGSSGNLRALVAGDMLYADSNFKPIPYPVLHSFADGLKPWEYVAAAFGARKSIIDTKLGTASGGYFAKRLAAASHRLVVTAPDAKTPPDTARGLATSLDDPDNEGALLAAPAGPLPRNTVLDRDAIDTLRKHGVKRVLVRSPLVGGPADGGVYGHDVGVRERGRVAPVGDYVGLTAAQVLAEPITQLIIGSKHCLVKGTLVRLADWSTKAIEDVVVGDMVLGADMTGRTFPVRVVNTYANGVRDCVRTTFVSGKRSESLVLESTPEHKILATTLKTSCKEAALNGQLRQLRVDHVGKRFFAASTVGFVEPPGMPSEPRALLLGLLLGDGCYTEALNCDPHLSCADPQLVEDLGPYLAGFNLKLTKLQAGGGLMHRFSQIEAAESPRDAVTGRILSGYLNPAKRFLDAFGALGKYAHEKVIPDVAYTWDNESVAALIAGLFVTDGSIFQNTAMRLPFAGFGSTSRRMVEQFRELVAWRFGIHFGPIHANKSGSRKRTLYKTELAKFADVKRLRDVLSLYGVKCQRYDDLVAAGEAATANVRHTTRARLDAPYRSRRRSQEPIGLRETFDIEVDHPDHLFVLANGLIVSNSGGVAGTTKAREGFPVIDYYTSIPQAYAQGATHAQADGVVTGVRPAPQGGHYVAVDGKEHYVKPEQAVTVKPGDHVEAGDVLSDGVPSPAEFVTHKGIGEGRRRWAELVMEAARNSGLNPHRRNVELVARGLVDHVRLEREYGPHSPGDVVSYTAEIENGWVPREGSQVLSPKEAVGHYLEKPVLHYSVGTKVAPSHLPLLAEFGVKDLTVHKDPPPFTPVMVRSHDVLSHDKDPFTQMLGSNLTKNLLSGVARGAVADPAGTSFVPALAEGVHFGQTPAYKTTGWDAGKK